MTKGKNIVGIIPVRMASTRFPGKPLAKICGLAMVEHIRRRVGLCKLLSRVIVATCDEEIKGLVEGFGGEAVMTSNTHERCTERVAEAAKDLDADIIVNIQGDEPLVTPRMITQVLGPMLEDKACGCVNLICPIDDEEEFESPNSVKTVVDQKGKVLYFSREPIPSRKKTKEPFARYRQLGVIAFTKPVLFQYVAMPQTPLEKIESIDMMRLLENGYAVRAAVTDEPLYGVDTPLELKRVEELMEKDRILRKYL